VQLKKQTSGDGNLGAFTQVLLTMRTQFMAHLSKAPSFSFFLQWLWLPISSFVVHVPILHSIPYQMCANRLRLPLHLIHEINLWHLFSVGSWNVVWASDPHEIRYNCKDHVCLIPKSFQTFHNRCSRISSCTYVRQGSLHSGRQWGSPYSCHAGAVERQQYLLQDSWSYTE